MKKIIIYIILALFTTACCKNKCENFTRCEIPPEINDYFGMYKSGNWWVYTDQNNVVRDSIYVTETYSRYDRNYISKDNTSKSPFGRNCPEYKNCLETETRALELFSRHPISYSGNNFYVDIIGAQESCGDGTFEWRNSNGTFRLTINYDYINSKYTNIGNIDTTLIVNGVVYTDLISDITKHYFFAKNIGLVKWIPELSPTDTLSLKNYYIQ